MVTLSLVLGMFLLMITTQPSAACPESCFCMDAFVTCSDFKYLDLTLLPPGTDTLVLTKGEVEEIPPGFLATAVNLKMLELLSVHVRVVRGSSFRGLRNMDMFSIIGCSFDIVEPDGFSGLSEVSKFYISDSSFGRVGKHAFGYINKVDDLRIWSNNFETISDEAFYKLSDIGTLQFYYNNVTYMGRDVFSGAFRLGEVSISSNRIQTVLEGSFENIARATDRLVLQANTFRCSCEIAWFFNKPVLNEHLPHNHCSFKEPGISMFRMNDTSQDILCSKYPPTKSVANTPENSVNVAKVGGLDEFTYVEELFDPVADEHESLTDELMISTLASNLGSTQHVTNTVSPGSLISSDVLLSLSPLSSPLPSSLSSSSSSSPLSSSLVASSSSSPLSSSSLSKSSSFSISSIFPPQTSSSLSPMKPEKDSQSVTKISSFSKTSSIPNTSSTLFSSSQSSSTLSLSSILYSSLSSSSSSSPSISSTSEQPPSTASSSSSSSSLPTSLTSSESFNVLYNHDPSSTVNNNETYSIPTLNSSTISIISTSSSSSSPSSSTPSSQPSTSLPSSESHEVFHSHDLPSTIINKETYLITTLNSSTLPTIFSSSPSSSSPSSLSDIQITSQLNSEQPTNHSDISTSANPSNVHTTFPDATTPAAHTHNNSMNVVVQANESLTNTFVEETTAGSLINEISAHNSTDSSDLVEDVDIINENASPAELVSVSMRKHELGVPYSTAAFEVGNLFLENSSHTISGSLFSIVPLSGLCCLLIFYWRMQIA